MPSTEIHLHFIAALPIHKKQIHSLLLEVRIIIPLPRDLPERKETWAKVFQVNVLKLPLSFQLVSATLRLENDDSGVVDSLFIVVSIICLCLTPAL